MKAVVITGRGGAEVLEVREVADPEPQSQQVRVRVHAAGLNRADLMQARGHYPAPAGVPADQPGLEYAGVIEATGPDGTAGWKPGDRVYGLVGGGGLAQFVVVHERLVAALPSNLDFEQAAAVPEAFITAHDALENQARLRPGESVLIHAVGGGVGLAAAQIARASGCLVYGTSRTAWKLERAEELGVSVGIDTSRDDFAQVVLRETAGRGVPVLIDHLGASFWKANLEALATRGRLVLVGLLTGASVERVDLGTLLRKRLTVVGTTLRARGLEEKIEATRAFASRVNPWLERGVVRPVVDRVFGFEQIREAEEYLESNSSLGKVVVTLPR